MTSAARNESELTKWLALVDRGSGDYYYKPTDEYLCVAFVDGEPKVIGGYCAMLKAQNPDAARFASKRIWGNFISGIK